MMKVVAAVLLFSVLIFVFCMLFWLTYEEYLQMIEEERR